MLIESVEIPAANRTHSASQSEVETPNWLRNLHTLWRARRAVIRFTGVGAGAGVLIALLVPEMYTSQARIMPPEVNNSSPALMAALASRSSGSDALGGLAAALMGNHGSGALFTDLLRTGTVTGSLVEQFQLRKEYGKRYGVDAVKVLARRTTIDQDKKSGVITVAVRDHDPARARDMVRAYLDALNALVIRTSASPAHQERVFLEKRLASARVDLSHAQESLSKFSTAHGAIDLREQTRATLESQARLEGESIAAQAQLESLQQMYGDKNVHVRGMEARIASLKRELANMGGSNDLASTGSDAGAGAAQPYLPLGQVPRLAAPYADLVRDVRVQETVYELLTQQYEASRIQEAKDILTINVIDPPGIPEKRSFPPRTILAAGITAASLLLGCSFVLILDQYRQMQPLDPRHLFLDEVRSDVSNLARRALSSVRGRRELV